MEAGVGRIGFIRDSCSFFLFFSATHAIISLVAYFALVNMR